MKMRHFLATTFVALLSVSVSTHAAENQLYFGGKAGLMDADAAGHKDPLNIGAVIGFTFDENPNGSISLEGELTTTIKDGDLQGGGDWDIGTIGVYAAYRTAGDAYLKAKAGFVDQNASGTSTDKVPDDTGASFGFGVGFRTSRKAGLEFEYTILDDVDFMSLGFYTRF